MTKLFNNRDKLYAIHEDLFANNDVAIMIIDYMDGKIVKVNKAACIFYGYKNQELCDKNIKDITCESDDKIQYILQKSCDNHFLKSFLKQKDVNNKVYHVKIHSGPIGYADEKYVYFLIEDVTAEQEIRQAFEENRIELIKYSKLLEGVLRGIPDAIGVYEPDHTVMFYNEAGYRFFNESEEEMKGRKCYEGLCRNSRCEDCLADIALREKKLVKSERYIKEVDRYVDCSWNPVFDDSGEAILIIEQLRDITERRKLENSLKESEERYRNIVEMSPDAIIISSNDKIMFANNEAVELVKMKLQEIYQKSTFEFVCDEQKEIVKSKFKKIVEKKTLKSSAFYEIKNKKNEIIYTEVTSCYISYNGIPAVQSVIKNITSARKEIKRAAEIQKKSLPKEFPIADKAVIEVMYKPSKIVSGDFYDFHKVDDDTVIGILFDVSGNGLSAALNVSAFDVLFHEAASNYKNPSKIINYLNKKIGYYLNENYVAAYCFSVNFKKNELRIVSSGINNFTFVSKQGEKQEFTLKGPFLGMFEDGLFDEKVVKFQSEDRFYFFTDGIELLLKDPLIVKRCGSEQDIEKIKYCLNSHLTEVSYETENDNDDCTLISLKIK